ncbi:bleomycin resistance protein [Geodermatophilus dictyosporus]|uniref:bleomycin resistance protein n=1 Tax=Geodermatophilus dictyosporus TaxID=1523247 RepID=UPI00145C30A3|nr:bleomycin resistance protein [Geodermatophilus dictyosporus]
MGSTVVRRADAEDGTVAHAEVRCDDVVPMVASHDADYTRPPLVGHSAGPGLYLVLDDAAGVDDRFARGVAAGGTAVLAPRDTEEGTAARACSTPRGGSGASGPARPAAPRSAPCPTTGGPVAPAVGWPLIPVLPHGSASSPTAHRGGGRATVR